MEQAARIFCFLIAEAKKFVKESRQVERNLVKSYGETILCGSLTNFTFYVRENEIGRWMKWI